MSFEEGSLQIIDCRGMQGPALFAELTRAIKKQALLPVKLQILATDENFPSEIEDWSTISKHRVEDLSKSEDGVYSAHLLIEDTRPKTPVASPSNASRANPIVLPARQAAAPPPVSTSDATNTGIPIPEPEPADITAGSTRIEAAPTKSSKTESSAPPEKKTPETPKSSASIPLPPNNKTGANLAIPGAQKSATIPLPPSNKTGANAALPPVPKSNARIDLSALSKLGSQNHLPVAPKSVARIELPKELLSTNEEEAPKEQSIVAPLPQDSTRIELPPQKSSSKLIAPVPAEPEPRETDPHQESSLAAPLPQASDGYAITTPPPAPAVRIPEQPQYDDHEEDQESRESMTETGLMISDVSGMPSERALLHLSTLVLQAPNGPLQIIADAHGFEEKLRAWAQLTGIFVQEVQNADGRTSAILMIGQAPPPINQTQPVPITTAKPQENRGSLCITKNSPEALFAAMMLANAAAAKGTHVDILFCAFGVELLRATPPAENPLKKLFQRLFAWLSSKKQRLQQLDFQSPLSRNLGYKLPVQGVPSVAEMLQTANAQRVQFFVCATSLGLVSLAPNDMLKGASLQVTDLSLFTEAARQGGFSFTF